MFAHLLCAGSASRYRRLWKRADVLLFLLTVAGWLGCSTKPLTDPILGPDHVLNNIYKREGTLPGNLRRVAVLPLSYNDFTTAGASARESLEPVFQSELTKTARFELFFVKPSQLVLWTGRERWDDFEELPPEFLKIVASRTGCDGVLFSRISHFKAYPPMLLGWRMRLVDNQGAVWSADELFDAADQAVANSARRYDRAHTRANPALEDSRSILLFPSKFGQYTLAAVFETLPVR